MLFRSTRIAEVVEDMDRRGWVSQVAQVEAIAGELDGHIKALSSLVTRLMVRRRTVFLHLKGYDFRLILDYIRRQLESALRSQIALEVCSPMLFFVSSFLRLVLFGVEASTERRQVSRWLPPTPITYNTFQRSRSSTTSVKRGTMTGRAAGSGAWCPQG